MQSEYILGEIDAERDNTHGLPLSSDWFCVETQSWQLPLLAASAALSGRGSPFHSLGTNMAALNPFSPPEAECSDPPSTWKVRARRALLWILSVGTGAVLGYILFNPFLTLPGELVVAGLKPILQAAHSTSNSNVFDYFEIVAVAFGINLPNTIAVSFAAALCLKFLQRPRQVLYSSLLWPLFLFLAYWLQVSLLKLGALRAGLPTDHFPEPPGFKYTVILIFVTEIVFFIVVLLLDRQFNKQQSRVPSHEKPA